MDIAVQCTRETGSRSDAVRFPRGLVKSCTLYRPV